MKKGAMDDQRKIQYRQTISVMHIILFGAGGRLGSALERGAPTHTYLTPAATEVDITDFAAVQGYLATHFADLVINCAAFNDVNGAESKPDIADLVNGIAAGYIAEAAAKQALPVIHFSSDYVFGGIKRDGYVETDAPNPISAYGRSKLLGEQVVKEKNPRSYIVRTSRLYGPSARDANAKRSFVEIVLDLAAKDPAFSINQAEVSSPTLVDDLARHLETYLFTLPEPGIYHLANQGGCTWYEWAVAITEILQLPVTVTPRDPNAVPRAAKPPDFSVLLSTKIPPMRPWREALEDYLLHHYGKRIH